MQASEDTNLRLPLLLPPWLPSSFYPPFLYWFDKALPPGSSLQGPLTLPTPTLVPCSGNSFLWKPYALSCLEPLLNVHLQLLERKEYFVFVYCPSLSVLLLGLGITSFCLAIGRLAFYYNNLSHTSSHSVQISHNIFPYLKPCHLDISSFPSLCYYQSWTYGHFN